MTRPEVVTTITTRYTLCITEDRVINTVLDIKIITMRLMYTLIVPPRRHDHVATAIPITAINFHDSVPVLFSLDAASNALILDCTQVF